MRYLILLLCLGCASIQPPTGEMISGIEAIEIIKSVEPDAKITGIRPDSKLTLLSSDWVWKVLNGNPFYGNEPAFNKSEGRNCTHYTKDTIDFIRDKIPNAAIGGVLLERYKKPLIGPLTYERQAHHVVWIITDKGLVLIDAETISIMKIDSNKPLNRFWY